MNVELVFDMLATVAGGLGLFLLGMEFMSEGIRVLALDRMRALLARFTSNVVSACLTGTFVTSILQSSTVMTVMTIGFVNSGILTLEQAVGMIMGANIGTTVTALVIALPIGKAGLPIAGLAALVYLFASTERWRHGAFAVLGLGLIFLGLEIMLSGLKPIRTMPEFMALFALFQADSTWGVVQCVIISAVLAAVIHSSSAVIGITMGLAAAGVVTFPSALAFTLGADIGTTITAFLAALKLSVNARRAAYTHTIFNVIGVAVAVPLFGWSQQLLIWAMGADPGQPVVRDGVETFPLAIAGIAAFSTGFNLFNTALLLPFAGQMVRLVVWLAPDRGGEDDIARPRHIFPGALGDPETALRLARAEQIRLIGYLPGYLESARALLAGRAATQDPARLHQALLQLGREIDGFLGQLVRRDLPAEHADQLLALRQLRDNFAGVEEKLAELVATLRADAAAGEFGRLAAQLVEALDALMLTAVEAIGDGAADDLALLSEMTGDHGSVMERLRGAYLGAEAGLSLAERARLLSVTLLIERIAWLINAAARYARPATAPSQSLRAARAG